MLRLQHCLLSAAAALACRPSTSTLSLPPRPPTCHAGQRRGLPPLEKRGARRRVPNACQGGHPRRCCIQGGRLRSATWPQGGRSFHACRKEGQASGGDCKRRQPGSAAQRTRCSRCQEIDRCACPPPTLTGSGGSFSGGSAAGLGGGPTAAGGGRCGRGAVGTCEAYHGGAANIFGNCMPSLMLPPPSRRHSQPATAVASAHPHPPAL